MVASRCSGAFFFQNLHSPGCLGNNIGTTECFGFGLFAVSQLWDQGAANGDLYTSSVIWHAGPKWLQRGSGNTSLQPLPFKSLISTWQLNIAPEGIDNRKPKADYFRVKSLEGLPLLPPLDLQCKLCSGESGGDRVGVIH